VLFALNADNTRGYGTVSLENEDRVCPREAEACSVAGRGPPGRGRSPPAGVSGASGHPDRAGCQRLGICCIGCHRLASL